MTYEWYVYPNWVEALAWVLALFSFLLFPFKLPYKYFIPKGHLER